MMITAKEVRKLLTDKHDKLVKEFLRRMEKKIREATDDGGRFATIEVPANEKQELSACRAAARILEKRGFSVTEKRGTPYGAYSQTYTVFNFLIQW